MKPATILLKRLFMFKQFSAKYTDYISNFFVKL